MPSAGFMKRIEIEGQYDLSKPFSVFQTRNICQVNLQQMSIEKQPANWTAFCEEVNKKLQSSAMNNTKFLVKCCSILIVVIIFVSVIPTWFFRRIWLSEKGGVNIPFLIGYSVSIWLLVGTYFVPWFKAHRMMKNVYKEIRNICIRYDVPNVVSYYLRDELVGGCSQVHSRRRFFIVNIYDNSYDTEAQQHPQQGSLGMYVNKWVLRAHSPFRIK